MSSPTQIVIVGTIGTFLEAVDVGRGFVDVTIVIIVMEVKGSDLDIFQTVLRSLQSRSKIRRNGILSVKFFNDSRDFIEVFTHRVEARGLGIEKGRIPQALNTMSLRSLSELEEALSR